jgi:cell wall-associated NlpC family hydrolase
MSAKKISLFISISILIALSSDCIAQKKAVVSKQDSIVLYARTFIGTPYYYGGCSPQGFDCSGFTYYIFRHFDIKVPRSAAEYAQQGKKISIDSSCKGDIILFTGTDLDHSRVGHVGIVISEKGEPLRFIHASSSRNHWGVTITDYNDSGYTKRFMGIRRF